MPKSQNLIQLFVGAPGDVTEERDIIKETLDDWNTHRGSATGWHAEMVWWGNASRPAVGDRPQEIINRQTLDDADIVVAIFWTRFGTPTGIADSGTAEEIMRSINDGKDVLLYFCDRRLPPSKLDTEQYKKVQKFREELEQSRNVYYHSYGELDDFRKNIAAHMAGALNNVISKHKKGEVRRPESKPVRKGAEDDMAQPPQGNANLMLKDSLQKGSDPLEKPEYLVKALFKSDAYFKNGGLERFLLV